MKRQFSVSPSAVSPKGTAILEFSNSFIGGLREVLAGHRDAGLNLFIGLGAGG